MLWLVGRGVRRLTLVSGAIWLLTLPLVMARFHIFNPIAVLINTAVWLPMAGALVSGLALLLCSMIPGPLAAVCAVFCNGLLGAVEWLVRFGEHVPYGHTWVPGPAEWWLIGLYAGLAVFAAFPRLRPPLRWRLALLGAWTAAGVIIPWWTTDRHGLRCTFLSVGHGESIVLELPDGRTVLYDAGRLSAPTSCCRIVSGYLWSRGLTHIDAVVLSHADTRSLQRLAGVAGTVFRGNGLRVAGDVRRAERIDPISARGDRPGEGADSRDCLRRSPAGRPGVLAADSPSAAARLAVDLQCQQHRAFRGIWRPPGVAAGRSSVARFGRRLGRTPIALRHAAGAAPRQPDEHARELSAWSTPDWSVFSADHRYDTSRSRRFMRGTAACCTRPTRGP